MESPEVTPTSNDPQVDNLAHHEPSLDELMKPLPNVISDSEDYSKLPPSLNTKMELFDDFEDELLKRLAELDKEEARLEREGERLKNELTKLKANDNPNPSPLPPSDVVLANASLEQVIRACP